MAQIFSATASRLVPHKRKKASISRWSRSTTSLLKNQEEVTSLIQRKFIKSGYLDNGTFHQTICTCHNETVNIYTHLVPLILIIMFLVVESTVVISFLFSIIYHTSRCIMPQYKLQFFLLDVFGVFCMNMGFIVSAIYVSFICFPFWQFFYICFYFLLFLVVIVPVFFVFTNVISFKTRQIIQLFYNITLIIPFVHLIILLDGNYDDLIHFQNGTLSMCTFAMIAKIIFYFDIPERWYPNKFDLFGWSHNWFHILSVAASFSWGYCLNSTVKWRISNACNLMD